VRTRGRIKVEETLFPRKARRKKKGKKEEGTKATSPKKASFIELD